MAIFKTKVRWFKREPKITQYEWTHIYMNSLDKPVRCVIITDQPSGVSGRPFTVYNENGVTVYLLKGDLETIEQYNRRINGMSTE